MKPTEVNCPSCGATTPVYNPGVIMITCEYCGNAVYWDEDKIKDAGKQSVLPEGFSRLYRGATGSLFHKRFNVLGRIRYSFGQGFWDEWFLEFEDGSTGWLTEDNHEFALEEEELKVNVPPFEKLRPGAKLHLKGKQFYIEEIGLAECLGVEGELPFPVLTGEKYHFADGSTPDGNYTIGIEYDKTPPTVFTGRWLKHASLQLDDEGIEW